MTEREYSRWPRAIESTRWTVHQSVERCLPLASQALLRKALPY
jgi:hypothetical protein